MKKLLFHILILFFSCCSLQISAQSCIVDLIASADTLKCGDTVGFQANGSGKPIIFQDDFNGGEFLEGWDTVSQARFDNPCDINNLGADGSPAVWTGNGSGQNVQFATSSFDLTNGDSLCFDFRMAQQGGSSPCEGPDLPNEGVYVEYSIDSGATWQTLFYFNPDTVCCGCPPTGCGGGPLSPFLEWNTYCFQIPNSAKTPATNIRLYQDNGSGGQFDSWGFDNISISGEATEPYQQEWYWMDTNFSMLDSTYIQTVLADTGYFDTIQNQTTGYVVMYFNSSDTCYDTVTVVNEEIPIIASVSDTFFCEGDTLAAQVNGGESWLWESVEGESLTVGTNISCDTCDTIQLYPSQDLSIRVTSNLSGICHDADTIRLYQPELKLRSNDTMICAGDSVLLLANYPFDSVLWNPTPAGSVLTDSTILVSPTSSTTYIASVPDSNACKRADSVEITVPTTVRLSIAEDTIRDCTQPLVEVNGKGRFDAVWRPESLLAKVSNDSVVEIRNGASGWLSVSVNLNSPCVFNDSVYIDLRHAPHAAFKGSFKTSCEGTVFETDNLSANASSFEWFLNTVLVSDQISPELRVGEGSLSLIASNDSCFDTTIQNIRVEHIEDNVFIPNVITPNNDGVNDFFEISNSDFTECTQLSVYNRWGQLVFSSKETGIPRWNGYLFSGNAAPNGQYFYVLNVNSNLLKGSFYLTR